MKINKKVELNKNVGGIFFLKFNKNVIPKESAGGIFFLLIHTKVDYFSADMGATPFSEQDLFLNLNFFQRSYRLFY